MTAARHRLLLAAIFVAALAATLYETRVLLRQRDSLAAIRHRLTALERELSSTRADDAARARELAATTEELDRLRREQAALAPVDRAVAAQLDNWLQRVTTLKQQLAQRPALQIPELQFLTTKDWLDATKDGSLDTNLGVRRSLSRLRELAKWHVFKPLSGALTRYLEANHQQPPPDASALAPFLDRPIDPAILQRYTLASFNEHSDDPRFMTKDGLARWFLRENQSLDDYYDSTLTYGPDGAGMLSWATRFSREVDDAANAYRRAHNSQSPTDPAQLAPYLAHPLDPDFIRDRLNPRF